MERVHMPALEVKARAGNEVMASTLVPECANSGDKMLGFLWRPLLAFCSFILMLNWLMVKNRQFVLGNR